MKRLKQIGFLSLYLAFSGLCQATVLSDLAASMKPGAWAELPCTGFNYSLLSSGVSYHYITQYSDDAVWNPVTQEVYYIGGGHLGTAKFISYSAATNAWREETQQSWMVSGMGHGYDHNAIDVARQLFYHRPMNVRTIIYRYNIATKGWNSSGIPASLIAFESLDCCVGFTYFPEMKSLVVANSRSSSLLICKADTWKWTTIENCPMGYANFARYNPVLKQVWFGGGVAAAGNFSYKLDSTAKVTKLKDAPFALTMGPSVQVVDPVSGKYLVFGGSGEFYVFDMANDIWTKQSATPPFFSLGPDGPVFGTVATEIPDYGVVMFCTYAADNSKVFLYKHSAPASITRDGYAPDSPYSPGLNVSPNPFRARTSITVHGIEAGPDLRLQVLDVRGRCIASLAPSHANSSIFGWDATGFPAGIYVAKCLVNGRILTKRILIQE